MIDSYTVARVPTSTGARASVSAHKHTHTHSAATLIIARLPITHTTGEDPPGDVLSHIRSDIRIIHAIRPDPTRPVPRETPARRAIGREGSTRGPWRRSRRPDAARHESGGAWLADSLDRLGLGAEARAEDGRAQIARGDDLGAV